MTVLQAANKFIPKADSRAVVTYPLGVTGDIINEVLLTYKDCRNDLKAFAPYLKGNSHLETASNIWHFVKKYIAYKEDASGVQLIKTPARIWQDRECDCKGYSIFIGCLLYSLGIGFRFRFVSFNPASKLVTHVYIVAESENGTPIYIDDVLKFFNTEKPYQHKDDFMITTQISRLSGIGCNCASLYDNRRPVRNGSIAGIGGGDFVTGIGAFKIPTNAQGNTTDELISKALLIERLEIEKAINQQKAIIAGIGALPTAHLYDLTINKIRDEIKAETQAIAGVAGVGNIFKKIGQGIKKVTQAVVKVATFPLTLPMKAIMEVALPQAAPGFIYVFIYPEFQGTNKVDLFNKVPEKVRKKAALQRKLMDFVKNAAGFKESHVLDKLRNGIMKKFGKHPEVVLAEKFGIKVSGIGSIGIGWVGAVLNFVIQLIQKVVGLFKKKDKPSDGEIKDSLPTDDDFKWEELKTIATETGNVVDKVLAEQAAKKEAEDTLKRTLAAQAASDEAQRLANQTSQQINPNLTTTVDNTGGGTYNQGYQGQINEYGDSTSTGTGYDMRETFIPTEQPQLPPQAAPANNNNMIMLGGAALLALLVLKK